MELKAMDPNNGPGWRVDAGEQEYGIGERTYQLWAPNKMRKYWAAAWHHNDSLTGSGYRQGSTMDNALASLPGDKESREAAEMLRQAAKEGEY